MAWLPEHYGLRQRSHENLFNPPSASSGNLLHLQAACAPFPYSPTWPSMMGLIVRDRVQGKRKGEWQGVRCYVTKDVRLSVTAIVTHGLQICTEGIYIEGSCISGPRGSDRRETQAQYTSTGYTNNTARRAALLLA